MLWETAADDTGLKTLGSDELLANAFSSASVGGDLDLRAEAGVVSLAARAFRLGLGFKVVFFGVGSASTKGLNCRNEKKAQM